MTNELFTKWQMNVFQMTNELFTKWQMNSLPNDKWTLYQMTNDKLNYNKISVIQIFKFESRRIENLEKEKMLVTSMFNPFPNDKL